MISGTYVLTDTISAAFTTIFDKSYENADAVVSGKVAFKNTQSDTEEIPAFPASVLGKVRELPDVAAAEGSISDEAKLVGRDGKTITHGFAASLAFSVNPEGNQRFNPLTLVDGKWPSGGTQIAIDQKTAGDEGYKVGDTIGVSTDDGVQQYEIEGIAKFASVSSIGGATIAIFDLPTAQRLFHKEGQLDEIQAAAKPGVTPAKLVDEIRPVLPRDRSGEDGGRPGSVAGRRHQLRASASSRRSCSAFGGVALFVGAFVIANTLSITIAQRVREFATIRTIGGSRRQVLTTVMVEALVIGVVASVIGLAVGLLLAKGLNALFVAIGLDFPKGDDGHRHPDDRRQPARRRDRHAACEPAAGDPRDARCRRSRRCAKVRRCRLRAHRRLAAFMSVATLVVGILLLSYGIFGHGLSTATRLFSLARGDDHPLRRRRDEREANGAAARLGARLARDADRRDLRRARPRERDAEPEPHRVDGVGAHDRARPDHVRRDPRTGTALVVRERGRPSVHRRLRGHGAERVRSVQPCVGRRRRGDAGRHGGLTDPRGRRAGVRQQHLHHCRPAERRRDRAHRLDAKVDSSVPSKLGKDGAFVDKDYAKDHDLSIGSPIAARDAHRQDPPPQGQGRLRPAERRLALRRASTMSNETFDANYTDPKNLMTLVNIKGGINDANTARLGLLRQRLPRGEDPDGQEFKKTRRSSSSTAC